VPRGARHPMCSSGGLSCQRNRRLAEIVFVASHRIAPLGRSQCQWRPSVRSTGLVPQQMAGTGLALLTTALRRGRKNLCTRAFLGTPRGEGILCRVPGGSLGQPRGTEPLNARPCPRCFRGPSSSSHPGRLPPSRRRRPRPPRQGAPPRRRPRPATRRASWRSGPSPDHWSQSAAA